MAVDPRQRGQLHRVAGRRARAVGLHIVDGRGVDTRGATGAAEHILLGGAIGRHDADGPAVLGHGAAAYHRDHPVVVPAGVGEPLEHHHRGTLAAPVPVGGIVEGFASTIGGGGPGHVEHPGQTRADQRADTTGEGQRGLTRPEKLTTLVYGHQ